MQATGLPRAFPCWDEPDSSRVRDHARGRARTPGRVERPEVERRTVSVAGGEKGGGSLRRHDVMSTYLAASSSVRSKSTTQLMWAAFAACRARARQGPPHRLRARCRRVLLRWYQDTTHPTRRQGRSARLPDFAGGRWRTSAASRSARACCSSIRPRDAARAGDRRDVVATSWPTCGSATWSRWAGGTASWLNEAFATFMEIAGATRTGGLGALDELRTRTRVAFRDRFAGSTRSVEYEVAFAGGLRGDVRRPGRTRGRALLRCSSSTSAPTASRRGSAVPEHPRPSQHRHGRSLGCHRGTSGEPFGDDGFLDLAARIPTHPPPASRATTWCCASRPSASMVDSTSPTLWMVRSGSVRGAQRHTAPDGTEARVTLSEPSAGVRQRGWAWFFRVSYDETLRARLTATALRRSTRSKRYNLVDDAWNAVIAGDRGGRAVDLLEGFAEEREYAVWQAIVISLRGSDGCSTMTSSRCCSANRPARSLPRSRRSASRRGGERSDRKAQRVLMVRGPCSATTPPPRPVAASCTTGPSPTQGRSTRSW